MFKAPIESNENHFDKFKDDLITLTKNIQIVLKENFIGFYVTGSLASGNWDLKTSDIDICIVIKEELTEVEGRNLHIIHHEFLKNELGAKLEGEYVTLKSLKEKDYSGMVGTVINGEFSLSHNDLSDDNLVGLNQNSIAIAGPAFNTLGVKVTVAELKEAVRVMLQEDRDEAGVEQDFGNKLYLLVNSLRCIYTLRTGQLPTKQNAVEVGKDLLSKELYQNLQSYYFEGKKEEFDISNPEIVSVMEFGLGLK